MRLFLLASLLFIKPLTTFSQGSSPYRLALEEHIKYNTEIEQKVFKRQLDSVLVEINEQSSDLPSVIGSVRIVLVDKIKVKELTNRGNRLFIVEVRPAKVGEHTIVINVINFSVTRSGSRFKYLNGGGSILEYKYNCLVQQYELISKKQGGI